MKENVMITSRPRSRTNVGAHVRLAGHRDREQHRHGRPQVAPVGGVVTRLQICAKKKKINCPEATFFGLLWREFCLLCGF